MPPGTGHGHSRSHNGRLIDAEQFVPGLTGSSRRPGHPWKVVFLENRGQAFEVWREQFVELRVPLLFNLRRDPFEDAQHNANV